MLNRTTITRYWRVLALVAAALLTVVGLGLAGSPVRAQTEDDLQISQDNSQIILTLNNPSGSSIVWQYAEIADGVCDSSLPDTDYTNFGLMIENNQAVLPLPGQFNSITYCFRVTLLPENLSIWKIHTAQAPVNVDTRGPTILFQRPTNQILRAYSNDTDVDQNSWFKRLFDQETDCASADINQAVAYHNLSTVLQEANNGQYYCFRVSDTNGNTGYGGYPVQGVDTTAPTISIQQNNRLLTATAGGESVFDWSYAFSPRDISCDSSTFLNNRSQVAGSQVTLTADHINYYYCFRARDDVGNFGYAKQKIANINFSIPAVILRQEGLLLSAESNSHRIQSWHYLKFPSAVDCNKETDFTEAVDFSEDAQIDLAAEDHLAYFCVRGFSATNTPGFARLRVDAEAPSIELKLSPTSIVAEAGEDGLTWDYLKSEQAIDCDAGDSEQFTKNNIDYHLGSSSQLYEADNGSWICFRAEDNAGNFGFAKQKIAGITQPAPGVAGGGSRGQIDIIVIASLLVLGLAGFTIYKLRQSKRRFSGEDIAGATAVQASEPAENQPEISQSETTEPLDYLKPDQE